jgi:pimeloyl-ACP methyl ester carboxylesterase
VIHELPDGRALELWSGGDPDGFPVVFFPGCPDSRLIARTGAPAAKELGVRLIAVNRPGYGQSTPAATDHLSLASDVAQVVGPAALAVLGMSVGGPYALALAAHLPDQVTAAGVVGAPHWERPGVSPGPRELFEAPFLAFRSGIDPTDPDDVALARRWAGTDPALARRSLVELAEEAREALMNPEGYLSDAVITFRPWAFALGDVRCPVHLWYGETDEPGRGAALASELTDADLRVLPATGHLEALLDHWPDVLAALLSSS